MKVKDIAASLAIEFAALDADIAVKNVEWAKRQCAAIQEYKDSEEGKADRKNVWVFYPKLHAIAGGKTWYAVFQYGFGSDVEAFMNKNSKATADKRNAKIAKDLAKVEISEVLESNIVRTHGGFDGVYKVVTDKGVKIITINTVGAGGYNIQCFHLRVLVKIK